MKIHLQYGRGGLDVDVPGDNVTVLRPQFVPGLADEQAGFVEADIYNSPANSFPGSIFSSSATIASIKRPPMAPSMSR